MKTVLQSRTIWLAIIQAVASVLIVLFTELDMGGYALMVKSLIDIVLRLETKEAIK